MCGQLFFVTHLIEYAFVGISLSDAKFMGVEYYNESRNVITGQITGICAIIYWPKKSMS